MREQIIDIVGKSHGLFGLALPGLVKESVELHSGFIMRYYLEKKRGRKTVKGKQVCAVCSRENAAFISDYSEKVDFKNGLCVLFCL